MTLNDCIQTALQNNLNLQIEQLNPTIAHNNLKIAYTAYDPNLTLGYQHNYRQQPGNVDEFNRPIPGTLSETDTIFSGINGRLPTGLTYNIRANTGNTAFSIPGFGNLGENANGNITLDMTQPILRNLLIDPPRLQIKLNKITHQQTQLALTWQIMNTIAQVEQAYYNLIAAQANLTIQQQAVQLAQQFLNDNRKRVQVGAMAPLDEKQAEAQLARDNANLLQAQGNLLQAQNTLKNHLTQQYLQWENTHIQTTETLRAIPTILNRQNSWHKAMTQRPDLQRQQLLLRQQGIRIQFSRNQILPQLDVTGSFGYSAGGRNIGIHGVLDQFKRQENPLWSIGGQLTIPIGNRQARREHKNAIAQQQQTVLRLKQYEQNIMLTVENALINAQTQLQRIQATQQQLQFSQAALNAEQTKFENGKSTPFQILQLQRDLTQARSQEIQALAAYNIAISNLTLQEGTTLQNRQITLQTPPN